MRSMLALIGFVVAAAACSPHVSAVPQIQMLPPGPNTIVITVTCAGTGVVMSVDPWVATATVGMPIVWSLDPASQVQTLSIDRVAGGPWPFKAAPPYTVTQQQPASQLERDPLWPGGRKARYMISGFCNGLMFNLDPDMIVD